MEDLVAYVQELENRVIYLEEENAGLYRQFKDIHKELATRVYSPRVILPVEIDYK